MNKISCVLLSVLTAAAGLISALVVCMSLSSCGAQEVLPQKKADVPSSFTADITIISGENEYSGRLTVSPDCTALDFTAPDGLKNIKAEYTCAGLNMICGNKTSAPAGEQTQNSPLTAVFRAVNGLLYSGAECTKNENEYVYTSADGSMYADAETGYPKRIEGGNFTVTFKNISRIQ